MSTSIEWTDETWNPTVGCSKVSPGCEHCYAINVAHRGMSPQHRGLTVMTEHHGPNWTGEVRPVPAVLGKPLHWRKPRRVFVNSMSDLFHESLVCNDEDRRYIAAVFAVMAATPHITYQILTKRPESAREWFDWLDREADGRLGGLVTLNEARAMEMAVRLNLALNEFAVRTLDTRWPLPNVWLGVTAEDQQRSDERIPVLLDLPAAVRFVSVEPMLGPVALTRYINMPSKLGWVICGGESGTTANARPMRPEWARSLRDQCALWAVPFMFKQWGQFAWCEYEDRPADSFEVPVGKKKAGRELDGRTHDEFPEVRT